MAGSFLEKSFFGFALILVLFSLPIVLAITITLTEPIILDNSYLSSANLTINMTIDTSINILDVFLLGWNNGTETNYTFYDNSLSLAMNFNNNSAIGENSTFFVDISKWGNNASCSGTACPIFNSQGKFHGAMQFDGVDDYVNISGATSLNISNAITLEVWINSSASQWTKKKSILINGSVSNLTDYETKIIVDYDSEMQADYDDFRFYYSNLSSLHYWIENYTSSNATVWVKVPFIPANTTTTIFLYYGNPSASSVSSGINTFELFEDFQYTNLSKYANNPVMKSDVAWEGTVIGESSILHEDGLFHMWYRGNSGTSSRIGYANSTDGITWTKYGSNPLSIPLNVSTAIYFPDVIKVDSVYYMFAVKYPGDDLYRFNSTDGINWNEENKGNPVLSKGVGFDSAAIANPSVYYDESLPDPWQMLYEGYDGNFEIGYANSTGGLTWSKYSNNPILPAVASTWKSTSTGNPWLTKIGDTYYTWYGGTDGTGWDIGWSKSVGNMTNWTDSPRNPEIDNAQGWEGTDVADPHIVYNITGETYETYIFYGGGQNATGLAYIPDQTFQQHMEFVDKNWTASGGTWTIQNGILNLTSSPLPARYTVNLTHAPPYIISAKVKQTSDDNWMGLNFRTNGTLYNSYFVTQQINSNLLSQLGGTSGPTMSQSLNLNQFYNFEIRDNGTQADFYFEGQHVGNQTGSANNDKIGVGLVSWGTLGEFDNFYVRQYVAIEPIITMGNETAAGISKAGSYGIGANTTDVFASINNKTISAAISSGWNHIVLTYDGEIQKLYVNNQLKSSSSFTGAIDTNTNDFFIGDLIAFKGDIDELRIYNKSLASSEISMHYQSEFQKYNSTQWHFYDNLTNLSDGVYHYSSWANDTTGANGISAIKNFTVDTITPIISISFPTLNNSNNSNINMDINYTSSDTNLASCWYSNDTYLVNTTLTNCRTNITTLTWSEGQHNITVYANDSAGHLNWSTISFTIDATLPTGTLSCTPSSVNLGETVTCTCSVLDSLSGVNTSATVYTAVPSTNTAGTNTKTCTFADLAGNTGTASTTFNVVASVSTETTTSSGSSSTTVITQTTEEISPDNPAEIIITDSSLDLTEITINVAETIPAISLTLTKIDISQVESELPPGQSYQAFKINTLGLNNSEITNVSINFKINKFWLLQKNKNISDLKFYRKPSDNISQWDTLLTTPISEDCQYYYFQAISPGFSTFVIFFGKQECNPGVIRCFENNLQFCLGNSTWLITEKCKYSCRKEKCINSPFPLFLFQSKFTYPIIITLVSLIFMIVSYIIFIRKKHKER